MLYVRYPSFGSHSPRYHPAPTHKHVWMPLLAYLLEIQALNLPELISQTGGPAAGGGLSASAFRSTFLGLDPANQMEGEEDDIPI